MNAREIILREFNSIKPDLLYHFSAYDVESLKVIFLSGAAGAEEYPSVSEFPVEGSIGVIYVALDTTAIYLWSPINKIYFPLQVGDALKTVVLLTGQTHGTVPISFHNRGKNPIVEFFVADGVDYDPIKCDYKILSNGDITWNSKINMFGKIVIT